MVSMTTVVTTRSLTIPVASFRMPHVGELRHRPTQPNVAVYRWQSPTSSLLIDEPNPAPCSLPTMSGLPHPTCSEQVNMKETL